MSIFLRHYSPAILAGVICGIGNNFAEFFWPISIVGIFILLLFILNLKLNESAFLSGILFEVTFLSISFLWILKSYPLEWMGVSNNLFAVPLVIFIWLVVPVYMSIPFGFFSFLSYKILTSKIHAIIKAVLVASFWVMAENLRALSHALLFIGDQSIFYPHATYHSLAYTFVWSDFFATLLQWGGMYAISFMSIFLIALIVIQKNKKKLLALFLFSLILIQFFLSYKKIEISEGVNISFFTTQFQAVSLKLINKINRYEDSKKMFNKYTAEYPEIRNSDIVIFPENTYFIAQSPYLRDLNLLGFEKVLFLDSGRFQGEYLLTYMKNGVVEYYKKQMLLPQGEYSSYLIKYFAIIFQQEKWIKSFEAERATIPGSVSSVYATNYFDTTKIGEIKIGGILCNEIISPVFFRKQTEAGANILVALASHAIFPNSQSLLNQTISVAKVRAIENNRFLVQSTNKNSSFVISNKGEVMFVSNPRQISLHTIKVPLIESKTYYTKYGDLITIFSFLLSTLAVGHLFIRRKYPL